jgi:hypothetical protein
VAAILLGAHRPAHAYLDPGTGSMIVQLLLGGVAGAIVILRLYWDRFKAFFGRGKVVEHAAQEPANHDAD